MKQIDIDDKNRIKQLLYSDYVFGIKDSCCRSFGGFQLWWYDKRKDICNCCQSSWVDLRRRVKQHSLDNAAKILWRNRHSLFLRSRHLSQDRELRVLGSV